MAGKEKCVDFSQFVPVDLMILVWKIKYLIKQCQMYSRVDKNTVNT